MVTLPKSVEDLLKVLDQANVLNNVLLVGAWAGAFYSEYFKSETYRPRMKTRDIDFALSDRQKILGTETISEQLESLGFESSLSMSGIQVLRNEELEIEFIMNITRGGDRKPQYIKELGVIAQPITHMGIFWRNPVALSIAGINVRLPHPADWAVQKIVISSKRGKEFKKIQDRQDAEHVCTELIKKGEEDQITQSISKLSKAELKLFKKSVQFIEDLHIKHQLLQSI